MTDKIFITSDGEELNLETTVVRLMRSATALEAIVKEQDILINVITDRLNVLESTVLDNI